MHITVTASETLPSFTVTPKIHEAEFPDGSLNTYTTWVLPVSKKDPGACDLEESVTTPELSVAEGAIHVIVVPPVPKGMVVVMSSTHVTTGPSLSTRKIKWQQSLAAIFVFITQGLVLLSKLCFVCMSVVKGGLYVVLLYSMPISIGIGLSSPLYYQIIPPVG